MPVYTLDHITAKVHEGAMFHSFGSNETLGAGASIEVAFSVGVNEMHIMSTVRTSGSLRAALFEAPTLSALGTPLVARNRNRKSSRQPTAINYIGPTITDDGTQIDGDLILGGSGGLAPGTVLIADIEWVFKPNTLYLGRLTNTTAQVQQVSVLVEWYEADDT